MGFLEKKINDIKMQEQKKIEDAVQELTKIYHVDLTKPADSKYRIYVESHPTPDSIFNHHKIIVAQVVDSREVYVEL